ELGRRESQVAGREESAPAFAGELLEQAALGADDVNGEDRDLFLPRQLENVILPGAAVAFDSRRENDDDLAADGVLKASVGGSVEGIHYSRHIAVFDAPDRSFEKLLARSHI